MYTQNVSLSKFEEKVNTSKNCWLYQSSWNFFSWAAIYQRKEITYLRYLLVQYDPVSCIPLCFSCHRTSRSSWDNLDLHSNLQPTADLKNLAFSNPIFLGYHTWFCYTNCWLNLIDKQLLLVHNKERREKVPFITNYNYKSTYHDIHTSIFVWMKSAKGVDLITVEL